MNKTTNKTMTKNEKYIFEKSPELYTAIKNRNLWFVRSVSISMDDKSSFAKYGKEEYVDMKNVLDYNNILSIPERPLFNQSINALVIPFTGENVWDCRPYIFVAPMYEYIGELVGGTQQDYLTIGTHTYSKESYLLVPNKDVDMLTKLLKPKLKSTIVGYNFPKHILGHEGNGCLSNLKNLSAGDETPRMAVEKLFDAIESEKGYDIWRLKKDLQLEGDSNVPKVKPSTSEINAYSIRINKKGDGINVDKILAAFNPLFEADGLSIEKLSKYIHDTLKMIMLKPTSTDKTDTSQFLYDYLSTIDPEEEFKGNTCAKLADSNLFTLNGFNMLSDYEQQLSTVTPTSAKYNDFSINYLTTIYNKSIQLMLLLEVIHMFKIQYITDTVAIQKLNKLIKTKLFDKNKFSSILHNIYNEEKDAFTTIKTITTIIADICYIYDEVDDDKIKEFDTNIKSFNEILDDAVKKLHTVFSIRKKSLASTSNSRINKSNTSYTHKNNTRKLNKVRNSLRRQSKTPYRARSLRRQSKKHSSITKPYKHHTI